MLGASGNLMLPIVFSIAAVVLLHVNAQHSCTTPRRPEPGVCVPISACKVINAMQKSYPRYLVDAYIQEALCGSLNEIQYVCCVRNYVTPEGLSAPSPGQLTPTISREITTTASEGVLDSDRRIHPSVAKSEADIQTGMSILAGTRCGYKNIDFVAHGEDASLEEFPWMALLVYDDGVQTTLDCGGSLITDRYVLTAAHCIRRSALIRLAKVRLGEYDTKYNPDCVGQRQKRKCAPPIQEIDIEEAIYHQDHYQAKFANDIGLIRLASKATINSAVQPICLPITPRSRNVVLPKMQIAGWGQIETGPRASVLQRALVLVRDNDFCQNIHRLITVTDKQLCAGGDEQIVTCKGDSGGPLFFNVRYRRGARFVQYGVVGGGATICGSVYPDVYASVISYLPWIAGNIRP